MFYCASVILCDYVSNRMKVATFFYIQYCTMWNLTNLSGFFYCLGGSRSTCPTSCNGIKWENSVMATELVTEKPYRNKMIHSAQWVKVAHSVVVMFSKDSTGVEQWKNRHNSHTVKDTFSLHSAVIFYSAVFSKCCFLLSKFWDNDCVSYTKINKPFFCKYTTPVPQLPYWQ